MGLVSDTGAAIDVEPGLDPWRAVPGQERAVAQLRASAPDPVHAFLFLGPPGAGKETAALVFAGEVLAASAATSDDAARYRRLAADGQHPDITIVRRVGAFVSAEQVDDIIRIAALKPMEGSRKVLVLDEFHLITNKPEVAGKLLKSIEEPPGGTVFIVLSDDLPDELITIASRCLEIGFPALSDDVVASVLVADGLDAERAARVSIAAYGDLDRARLLARDERFALRVDAWRAIPTRLDGSGATVALAVAELRAAIDDAALPLRDRQHAEADALTERIERYGQRGSGARALEELHRRQLRRLRTDELRMGFGELARTYRDRLLPSSAGGTGRALDPAQVDAVTAAVRLLAEATDSLIRNPTDELMLQALLLRLPALR